MEYKAVGIQDSLQIEDERVVKSIFAVMGNTDHVGDVIHSGAFKKTASEGLAGGHIKVLWQHDALEPPIGTPTALKELPKGDLPDKLRAAYPEATGALYGEWRALDTPRGNEVLAGIKAGAITQNSIGFDVVKWDSETGDAGKGIQPVRNLREVRLWDVSPVNWGANSATMNLKAALPFQATAKAPMDMAWDGPHVMAMCEGREQLRAVCAWVDPEGDPDAKASYKLPHHLADGKVVWRGVAASMAALMGSRGGVDIPEADRRGVYNHLAKHYAQFDQEPPDFKAFEISYQIQSLAALMAELKAGRVISDANMQRLRAGHDHMQQAMEHVHAVMMAAEPPKSALTAQALLARLAIAEREIVLFS